MVDPSSLSDEDAPNSAPSLTSLSSGKSVCTSVQESSSSSSDFWYTTAPPVLVFKVGLVMDVPPATEKLPSSDTSEDMPK